MPSRFAPPPAGRVRAWLARLDAPPIPLDGLAAAITPDEAARAGRFVRARDRDRYVVARGLVRHVLGAATDTPPARVRLGYGANGRPELAEGTPVAFNLSHTGDRLAIAVATGAPPRALGVDVELVREVRELPGVAARVYDEVERARLQAAPDEPSRLTTFHRLWTRKEACMKATGAGFTLPPHTFRVDADAAVQRVALPAHECAPEGAVLTVRDLPAGADCAGAVAMEGEDWELEVIELA